MTKIEDLTWTPNPDGEFREERAELGDRGIILVVFSNRDGTDWGYHLDSDDGDGECFFGYDTKEEAQQEALDDALRSLRRFDD